MEANFERIEAYEQGQLSVEAQQRFEEELATNEQLQEELALYRLSQQALEEGIGDNLRADMEQWDQEQEEKTSVRIRSYNGRWFGAAAAIFLLLGIFWWFSRGANDWSAPALAATYFPEKIKVENVRGTSADTSLTESLALIDRGTVALENGASEEANRLFKTAANQLSQQPSTHANYPGAQLQTGLLWFRLQEYDRALVAFNRVVAAPQSKYREEARWYRLLAMLAADGADTDFQLELEHLIQDPNFSLHDRALELKAKSAHLIEQFEAGTSSKELGFATPLLVFKVNPQLGGRITSFRYQGQEILSQVLTDDMFYFGSSLWPAPQSDWNWPPPAALDQGPYEVVQASADLIVLESISKAYKSLKVRKEFALKNPSSVLVNYTFINQGDTLQRVGLWENTRIAYQGQARWQSGSPQADTILGLTQNEELSTLDFQGHDKPHKLFVDSPEGWVAYQTGSLLFTKRFDALAPEQVAPQQAPIEIYYDQSNGFAELEVQGPYVALVAGGEMSLEVEWTLERLADR